MVMEFYTVEKNVKAWTADGLEDRTIHPYRKARRTVCEAMGDFAYEHPRASEAIALVVISVCFLLTGLVEGSTWPA